MAQPRLAKSPLEVQRAHDLLVGMMMAAVARGLMTPDDPDMQILIATASVLCWLLGHDYNQSFGDRLEGLEKILREHGMALTDTGQLQLKETVQ